MNFLGDVGCCLVALVIKGGKILTLLSARQLNLGENL